MKQDYKALCAELLRARDSGSPEAEEHALKQMRAALAPLPEVAYSELYDLLVEHELDPLIIPTIQELGKFPNGFGIVKRISHAGGLKKFYKSYVHYAAKRFYCLPENPAP